MPFQNQLFTILQMTLSFLFPAKKLGRVEPVTSHELKLLVQWLRSNQLCLNGTKPKLIIIRSPWKHLLRELNIMINNYKLKLHSHTKYLGIFMDEVLFWNKRKIISVRR